ncbi:MAG: GNAT family N-acetyltransferase [Paramuribaculum sp.]|nr:GNAT family N-acetyltransferase [Paramuribaculum sp.]
MIELIQIKALPTLMMWRQEVLRNVFGVEPSARLLVENRRYYREHIADDTHFAISVKWNGEDAGCGAICLTDELPSPDNPSGKCGYLMNIYVRQPYRQHGIAHTIVKSLVDEAKRRGCGKIYLETTEDGRPVYESAGFGNLPDMMKFYD